MTHSSLDQNIIEEISQNRKYRETTVEQVIWMERVIEKIGQTEIGENFALIGGSAIAFLYGNMYRLSVDLDLDYIANAQLGRQGSSELNELKTRHADLINDLAGELGMRVKPLPSDDERMLRNSLLFKSAYGKELSVDIDMGYRYCHSVLEVEEKLWQSLLPKANENRLRVQTLATEELWASQIVSAIGAQRFDFEGRNYLGSKRKLRHLFDTFYFVRRIIPGQRSIDLQLLRKLVFLFGATRIKDFELSRGDVITLYSTANIETELYPVLRTDESPPTLLEMQRAARKFLDKHIFADLAEKEYQFFEDFASGLFRPERLFGKGKTFDRLKGMYFYDEMLGKVIRRKGD